MLFFLLVCLCFVAHVVSTPSPAPARMSVVHDDNFDKSLKIGQRVYNHCPDCNCPPDWGGPTDCTPEEVAQIDYCHTKTLEWIRVAKQSLDDNKAALFPEVKDWPKYPAKGAFVKLFEKYFGEMGFLSGELQAMKKVSDALGLSNGDSGANAKAVKTVTDLGLKQKLKIRQDSAKLVIGMLDSLLNTMTSNTHQFAYNCDAQSAYEPCRASGANAVTAGAAQCIVLCKGWLKKNYKTGFGFRPLCQIVAHELFHTVGAKDVFQFYEMRKKSAAKKAMKAGSTTDDVPANNADTLGLWLRAEYLRAASEELKASVKSSKAATIVPDGESVEDVEFTANPAAGTDEELRGIDIAMPAPIDPAE